MDNESISIRDVRIEELDEISLLLKEAYQQYEKLLPGDTWHRYVEDITNVRSRLDESQLIVAEVNRQLVGAVTLYLNARRSEREGWPRGWAVIRLLAVRPSCRNRGIGHALVEECLRRCREEGIATVGLHTTEMMDVAQRMYEKMGFTRVPEFDFYPRPDVVVMAYRLDLITSIGNCSLENLQRGIVTK
ncbi:MAG: GNAT family N-acetyltransferase [Chloroflexi bacterium]|nr:GNAT family N-acetyltransferase [Chloroflexota bacterium]